MVVIGMGPSRSVDLACRDADRSESSHQEGGFFPAPSRSAAYKGKRSSCPGVGRCVDYFFVAPVVDLKDSVFHAEILDPRGQFLEEYGAGAVQIFVVDTDRHDEMAVQHFRNLFPPREGFPCLFAQPDILQEIFSAVIDHVPVWHVSVQELEYFLFTGRKGRVIDYCRGFIAVKQFDPVAVVFQNSLPVGFVRNETVA